MSTQTPKVCNTGFTGIEYNNKILCVTKDYYSVGGVRTPLSYPQAKAIADKNGWMLPTKEMVDAIWEQADLKLNPQPLPPTSEMTSVGYTIRHNNLIESQIDGRSYTLVAGHKKDVIQQQRPDHVTIYGWHRLDGTPIQPVSSVHGLWYKDYSHGVRFVYFPQ